MSDTSMNGQPIRALFSLASPTLADREEELRDLAAEVQRMPGCLEFDFFRDIEHPESFVQLELWKDADTFDHFRATPSSAVALGNVREMCTPFHPGVADFPRRHGLNGVEFYRFNEFERDGRVYVAKDSSRRTRTIQWPAYSNVRVVIEICLKLADDRKLEPYSVDTRRQPGCEEFSWLRSISYPENVLHLELWSGGPTGYDKHYLKRTLEDIWGGIAVPRPTFDFAERRYGRSGFEFYQHSFFASSGDVWLPEDPAARMISVRWF
jgi:quinol monooxygenase YgiN